MLIDFYVNPVAHGPVRFADITTDLPEPRSAPRDKALNGTRLPLLSDKADTVEFLRKKNTAVRLAGNAATTQKLLAFSS